MDQTNWRNIPLQDISVLHWGPPLDEARVEGLAESIGTVGLLHPVTLVEDENGFRAVAGRHRIAACRQRGDTHVPAVVLEEDTDPLELELVTIEENLRRGRLSAIEEAQALARAQELYRRMHPEAEAKPGRPKNDAKKSRGKPFAEAAAQQTGRSRRSVERDTALGEKIHPNVVNMLIGANHPVARNKTELAKLAALPRTEQRRVACQLVAGKLQRVPEKEVSGVRCQGSGSKKPKLAKTADAGGFHPHAKRIEEELQELLAAEPDWQPVAVAWAESLPDRLRG